MEITDEKKSYNEVPYPSFVFPQTSPDRLSTLARLRGIESAYPNRSRMLELGCGDGTNLIAFAYSYPRSRFVGIDLAEKHIDHAKRSAKELGLQNIEFIAGDLCELDTEELGKFDFIIAHGLFSWIPDAVREAVLTIYKECLSKNGVGYLSYNAYPGCHIRDMMNEMMRFHTEDIDDPNEKINESRSIIEFLSDAVPDGSVYGETLREELKQIRSRSDSNFFHDDLSYFNQPFYFHEFVSMMEEYGLTYIGEANPSTGNPDKLRSDVRETIFEISDDPLIREQYIDFIEKRRFRASLVCLAESDPLSEYDKAAMRSLRISSTLKTTEPVDLKTTEATRFSGPHGGLGVNHPLTKAILSVLADKGLSGMKYSEMMKAAADLIQIEPSDEEIGRSEEYLIRMFRADFINLHNSEPKFIDMVSEKPLASAFAIYQASNGSKFVTTLAETNLNIENPFIAETLKLCDGTRTKGDIANELKEKLNVPVDEMEKFEEALPEMIGDALSEFAATGLLIS